MRTVHGSLAQPHAPSLNAPLHDERGKSNPVNFRARRARNPFCSRVVGHFGAVQWMNLQLSPTTTITIFITKSLLERAGGVLACP